jgi:hypothetical protein
MVQDEERESHSGVGDGVRWTLSAAIQEYNDNISRTLYMNLYSAVKTYSLLAHTSDSGKGIYIACSGAGR